MFFIRAKDRGVEGGVPVEGRCPKADPAPAPPKAERSVRGFIVVGERVNDVPLVGLLVVPNAPPVPGAPVVPVPNAPPPGFWF